MLLADELRLSGHPAILNLMGDAIEESEAIHEIWVFLFLWKTEPRK